MVVDYIDSPVKLTKPPKQTLRAALHPKSKDKALKDVSTLMIFGHLYARHQTILLYLALAGSWALYFTKG